MSAGNKLRNSQIMDGVSFMDSFNVALAAAEKLDNVLHVTGNGADKVIAFYKSTDAITLTDYDGFPEGSIIHDQQAHKDHEKTEPSGTTGWVSSAARS